MLERSLHPRFVRPRLLTALQDNPVVVLHGPMQCGKSTLAREVGDAAGYAYFTFDDGNLAAAAREDPVGFVADLPPKAVLDEVQRVPQLFVPLKAEIDRNRAPGRALLTGSTNLLQAPFMSDSLAGRMEILRLHPLAQCELSGSPASFLDRLLRGEFKLKRHRRLGAELAERIVSGGYPPALAREQETRRREWYRNYVETLVQREVRALARLSALDALPKLLKLAASQTATLLNVSDLAAPFQLSRPTIGDYLGVLEKVFLLDRLPPWHSNRLSRLIKTPKIHVTDTGLACSLLGADARSLVQDRGLLGRLVETFVFLELNRQAGWRNDALAFHHYRDKDGDEVDVVLERGVHEIAGVEVKASSTATSADFRGLKKLREATGKRFLGGALLYDGDTTVRFDHQLYAVPIASLWED